MSSVIPFNEMKSSLISLLVILPVCLLICSEAEHAIFKRKAADGKYYVFVNRTGCVSVNESFATCPVSWKLSPYLAKHYKATSKSIEATVNLLALLGSSDECTNDLKTTFCSQGIPKCFEDGRTDYGEAKNTCLKMYNSCPKPLVDQYKKMNFCESLILTGKQPSSKCVFVTEKIPGVCPQPKHKMATDILKLYRKQSEDLNQTIQLMKANKNLYSDECTKLYEKMACNPVYCSRDEKTFITEYDQEDCDKVVKLCFDKAFGTLSINQANLVKQLKDALNLVCQTYPKGSSARMVSAPPSFQSINSVSSVQSSVHDVAATPTLSPMNNVSKVLSSVRLVTDTPTASPINGAPNIRFAKSLCFIVSAFLVKIAFLL